LDEGALAVVDEALTSLGFACTRLPFGEDAGRPRIENLYARRGSRRPNICFAGHTDVVPVGSGWRVPPFAADSQPMWSTACCTAAEPPT
jgi:succinyl-diaminopimelate desuccinylase